MTNAVYDPEKDQKIIMSEDIRLLDSRMGDIICRLDLETEAPVMPKRAWRQHLYEQITDIEQRIDRCLQRYAAYMEPEMIKRLQDLEHTSFIIFGKAMINMPLIDQQLNVNRSSLLGWGNNDPKADFFPELLELGKQLVSMQKEFQGMPKIPDVVDIEHKDVIDNLRNKT